MKKAHRRNQYWMLRNPETIVTATWHGSPSLFTSRRDALAWKAQYDVLKGTIPTKVRIALGWSNVDV